MVEAFANSTNANNNDLFKVRHEFIDANGLKFHGRVDEVFVKFWEGGYIGVMKIFGEGVLLHFY